MKKTILGLLFLSIGFAMAQERVNATGGEATGSGGTVSYSVGLIDYTAESSASGSTSAGVQQTYIQNVGVDEWDLSYDISVFPNPAINQVTIKIPENAVGFNYVLTDMNGKVVRNGNLTITENQLEISSLGEAMYFLNILANDVSVRAFKITKNQ